MTWNWYNVCCWLALLSLLLAGRVMHHTTTMLIKSNQAVINAVDRLSCICIHHPCASTWQKWALEQRPPCSHARGDPIQDTSHAVSCCVRRRRRTGDRNRRAAVPVRAQQDGRRTFCTVRPRCAHTREFVMHACFSSLACTAVVVYTRMHGLDY